MFPKEEEIHQISRELKKKDKELKEKIEIFELAFQHIIGGIKISLMLLSSWELSFTSTYPLVVLVKGSQQVYPAVKAPVFIKKLIVENLDTLSESIHKELEKLRANIL